MKKLKSLIIFIIIIFFLIYIPIVYASLAGNAQAENPVNSNSHSPSLPANPTPNRPQITADGKKIINIYHYRYISGYVYEDLEQYSEDTTKKIGVEGVEVSTIEGNNSTVTDENGYFKLDLTEGTYNLKFKYGDIDVLDKYDVEITTPEILKYNGHDYIVTETPNTTEDKIINVTETEVVMSKKGASQIFLLIDTSWGMRTTMVRINGEEKSRLEVAVDAAKKLVNTLLDSGQNIYIGIIAFSGQDLGATKPSKNGDFLLEKLDELASLPCYDNTNIIGALDKAWLSFYNRDPDTSNRTIVLISDGIPTSDGNVAVELGEDESLTLDKLKNQIGPATRDKVDQLVNDGVNLMALVVRSDEEEENEFVNSIYNGHATRFESTSDYQELAIAIENDVKQWIIDNTTSTHSYDGTTINISGYEDEERRELVDSYFTNTFYYNHPLYELDLGDVPTDLAGSSMLFKEAERYSSQLDSQILSEKTYMTATVGDYIIDDSADLYEDTEEIRTAVDPDTGVEYEYVVVYHHVNTGYRNQNVVIAQRPALSLITEVTATAIRITLSTGEVLCEEFANPGDKGFLLEYLDTNVAQGATIEIEYTVTIKNDSSLTCTHLELVNYIPDEMVYSDLGALITEPDVTNLSLGWQKTKLSDLWDGYITDESYENFFGRETITYNIDNDGLNNDGFYIEPGGKFSKKFYVSRVVSSEKLISLENQDAVEILGYQNNGNRRMAYHLIGTSTSLTGVYPGDMKDKDFSDCTNLVTIIPPTGLTNMFIEDDKLIVICGILIVSAIITVFYKIKKARRKDS